MILKVLTDNMNVNKGVGTNIIPTEILKDYTKLLVTWSKLLLQQVYSPVPLKWQISSFRNLLSNVSKIFEKMMHIWLTDFLK